MIGVRLPALQIKEKDGKQIVVLEEATKDVLEALKPFQRSRPPTSFFERVIDKAKELAARAGQPVRGGRQRSFAKQARQ